MKKTIITMLSVALLAIIGNAQETVSDESSEKILKKSYEVVAQLKEVVESKPILFATVVKNKPYSAEAVSESIRTLPDGNRIIRKTSVKMFRDSEGRTRREGIGTAGNFSRYSTNMYFTALGVSGSNSVSIYDPVEKVRYRLNTDKKTARRYDNQRTFGTVAGKIIAENSSSPKKLKTTKLSEMSEEDRAKTEKKLAEVKKMYSKVEKNYSEIKENYSNVVVLGSLGTLKYKATLSEPLGTKMFEGVEAEGTRTVRTIEAGAIGNDLPIEITYEKWYSKDLGLIVYSRKYDPRSGEQIYRLVNINQTEPDSSLFSVPSDYKIVDTKPVKFGASVKPKI